MGETLGILWWTGYVLLLYLIAYGPVIILFLVIFFILRFISKAQIRKNIKLAIYNIIVLVFIMLQGYFRHYSKGYLLLFGGSSFLKNLWNGIGSYFDYQAYGLKESFNYIPYQILFIIFLIAIIGIIVSNIKNQMTKKLIQTENNVIKGTSIDMSTNIANNISNMYKFLTGVIVFTTLYLYGDIYISQSGIHVPYINHKFAGTSLNLGKAITLRDYLSQDILSSTHIQPITNNQKEKNAIINDGNHIYQNGMILSGIDSKSFQIIDNSNYLKNADYESYISSNEYGLKEKYAYDRNNIYYSTGSIFIPLSIENYSDAITILKDIKSKQQRIYYDEKRKRIFGIDGTSFENTGNSNYVKDKNHVYFAENDIHTGRKKLSIVDCDINTFQAITIDKAKHLWSNYGLEFGIDKNHVYKNGEILTGIDRTTFSIIDESQYLKDKNHVYWARNISIMNSISDPESFTFIPRPKNSKFWMMNLIYAKDNNNFYKETEKGLIIITDEQLPIEFKQEDWYVSYRQSNNNMQENQKIEKGRTKNNVEKSKANFTVTLANGSNPTPNTFEIDVVLKVNNIGQGIKLGAITFGLNFNDKILNNGTPCDTVRCGSWDYITGSTSKELKGLNSPAGTYLRGQLRITQTPLRSNESININTGTYILGRYRFTNTVPRTTNSDAELRLQGEAIGGLSNTIVLFTSIENLQKSYAYTTTNPLSGVGLTLGYTKENPFSLILNKK